MKKFISSLLSLILALASLSAYAQTGATDVPMADGLRAEGKIYVVVAIILIVLAGLITYLFTMDRKVKKLKNLLADKNHRTK
ncbi:CcmD family protein [Chryseolinea lacunae]|uniref:CcmD family protein n=1 Tax=Chryseolinea lacunae TaxID=2801331 RepID=A0ABS1KSJ7_9BACT|nr:CcmD family protein [Chryseolinea lacunae]MBL0742197.1 CcmD family protein [Chryseolinea lacunae]